ncbi:MAG: 2Fe-2S iron-sulfur cluster binding domain-containing protein [Alphaproteobacteria bacterium]|nr:2Fe-2S iron-sulfur cluster binding domain-containing protein [Alphaproteobacteria bacterium]
MRIELTGRDRAVSFDCADDQEILFAGLAAGFSLPYECGTGTCATCKASVAEGDVDPGWADAPGRRLLKEGNNEILMCQARPRSDCRLTVRARLPDIDGFLPTSIGGEVVSVAPLNHNVFRLEIRPERPMPYDAGQFMLVGIPSVPGYRGWSMAAYDRAAETLVFTVKLMSGGSASAWLADRAKVGDAVSLLGPFGKASFRPDRDTADIVCIAGGSGLAPILAILERAHEAGHFSHHRADVFFGVRAFEDLYETDRLLTIAGEHPDHVALTMAFSETMPSPAEQERLPGVTIASGFVHDVMGQSMADRLADVMAYLAGPPPMVEAAMRVLVLQGKVPPARIRYDKFS